MNYQNFYKPLLDQSVCDSEFVYDIERPSSYINNDLDNNNENKFCIEDQCYNYNEKKPIIYQNFVRNNEYHEEIPMIYFSQSQVKRQEYFPQKEYISNNYSDNDLLYERQINNNFDEFNSNIHNYKYIENPDIKSVGIFEQDELEKKFEEINQGRVTLIDSRKVDNEELRNERDNIIKKTANDIIKTKNYKSFDKINIEKQTLENNISNLINILLKNKNISNEDIKRIVDEIKNDDQIFFKLKHNNLSNEDIENFKKQINQEENLNFFFKNKLNPIKFQQIKKKPKENTNFKNEPLREKFNHILTQFANKEELLKKDIKENKVDYFNLYKSKINDLIKQDIEKENDFEINTIYDPKIINDVKNIIQQQPIEKTNNITKNNIETVIKYNNNKNIPQDDIKKENYIENSKLDDDIESNKLLKNYKENDDEDKIKYNQIEYVRNDNINKNIQQQPIKKNKKKVTLKPSIF